MYLGKNLHFECHTLRAGQKADMDRQLAGSDRSLWIELYAFRVLGDNVEFSLVKETHTLTYVR